MLMSANSDELAKKSDKGMGIFGTIPGYQAGYII